MGKMLKLFAFQSFDLHKYIFQHDYLIILYGLIIFSSMIMFLILIKSNRNIWEILFSIIVIILSLIHQYALIFLATIIFILNQNEIKYYLQENKKTWIIYCIYTLGFWIFVSFLSGNYNKILHYLVGYPPIKKTIIIPLMNAVPKWSIIYFGIIIYSTVKVVLSRNKNLDASIFLLDIIYVCVVVIAIFNLHEFTTRYVFFFFPMVLVLGFIELKEIFTKIHWSIQQSYPTLWGSIFFSIPLILFMGTEDFHVNHILDVSSCEANFRIEKYSRFEDHWFERHDNKSPAQYVNQNFRKGDVVIINSIVVSKYLKEKAYFYCPIDSMWFYQFSRNFGKEEKFTGLPLIYNDSTPMDLIPKDKNRNLWFITGDDIVKKNIFKFSENHNLNIILRYKAIDGRHKVWKIGYKE